MGQSDGRKSVISGARGALDKGHHPFDDIHRIPTRNRNLFWRLAVVFTPPPPGLTRLYTEAYQKSNAFLFLTLTTVSPILDSRLKISIV